MVGMPAAASPLQRRLPARDYRRAEGRDRSAYFWTPDQDGGRQSKVRQIHDQDMSRAGTPENLDSLERVVHALADQRFRAFARC